MLKGVINTFLSFDAMAGHVIFEQNPSWSYWYEKPHAVTGEFLIIMDYAVCFLV